MRSEEKCPICGRPMKKFDQTYMCIECNDRYGDYYNFFARAVQEFKGEDGREKVIIECPGVTVYDPTNSEVVQGVKWNDPRDFSQGYTIVDKPVYAPGHQHRRAVDKEKAKNLTRCQACQDMTIKMRTFNNQKMRDVYMQDSPMMPSAKPGEDFSPLSDCK
jgi:hypothetical protein